MAPLPFNVAYIRFHSSRAVSPLTLFRLGVLEILYDWGGVECARAVCLFISQQFLTIELSFKFV